MRKKQRKRLEKGCCKMLSKVSLIVGSFLLVLGVYLYFSSNASYNNSIQARIYYFIGNYDEAYAYAKRAYEQDPYNKMAFTVLTQSQIAQKYEKYIELGNEYLVKIDEISAKKVFADDDRVRIKLMCEVMIDSYASLVSTKLTDKELLQKSEQMYKKFKKLYEELF